MLKPNDFELLRGLVYKRAGIVLSKDKTYLLETRLAPVIRARQMAGMDDLVAAVRLGRDETLLREIVEAMTTNETLFFRDIRPFDLFREEILPALIEARKSRRQLRIWSAACSTGQEPYSLAILFKELGPKLSGWRIEILATDLSREALDKAKVGLYSQFEVQRGLPIQMLTKYFKRVNETWQIDSAIRAMVRYRELNLLENFAGLGQFDMIFCRNVLIYFDQATKADILARMRAIIAADGYLSLGGSETVLGITDKFKPIAGQRGFYAPA